MKTNCENESDPCPFLLAIFFLSQVLPSCDVIFSLVCVLCVFYQGVYCQKGLSSLRYIMKRLLKLKSFY